MIKIAEIEDIYNTYLKLPEFSAQLSMEKLKGKLTSKYLCLAYFDQDKIVGFKLGYELDRVQFYSWIGGVDPDHRNKGIAKKLLDFQENWAKENGYNSILVKSTNRFIPMVKMLLSNGYLISDISKENLLQDNKIHFIKVL